MVRLAGIGRSRLPLRSKYSERLNCLPKHRLIPTGSLWPHGTDGTPCAAQPRGGAAAQFDLRIQLSQSSRSNRLRTSNLVARWLAVRARLPFRASGLMAT